MPRYILIGDSYIRNHKAASIPKFPSSHLRGQGWYVLAKSGLLKYNRKCKLIYARELMSIYTFTLMTKKITN